MPTTQLKLSPGDTASLYKCRGLIAIHAAEDNAQKTFCGRPVAAETEEFGLQYDGWVFLWKSGVLSRDGARVGAEPGEIITCRACLNAFNNAIKK